MAVAAEAAWIRVVYGLAEEVAEGRPQWGQRQEIVQQAAMAVIPLSKVQLREILLAAEAAWAQMAEQTVKEQNLEEAAEVMVSLVLVKLPKEGHPFLEQVEAGAV